MEFNVTNSNQDMFFFISGMSAFLYIEEISVSNLGLVCPFVELRLKLILKNWPIYKKWI